MSQNNTLQVGQVKAYVVADGYCGVKFYHTLKQALRYCRGGKIYTVKMEWEEVNE